MGFQALFKLIKCWRTPDIVREMSKQLGRRRRTRACRVPDECAGQTECLEQLTVVKTADELKRRERNLSLVNG